jgi:hypothetical protein
MPNNMSAGHNNRPAILHGTISLYPAVVIVISVPDIITIMTRIIDGVLR